MRARAFFLVGVGLVLAALVLPQSSALAITSGSPTGSVRAAMEATQLPAQEQRDCEHVPPHKRQECRAHRGMTQHDKDMARRFQ